MNEGIVEGRRTRSVLQCVGLGVGIGVAMAISGSVAFFAVYRGQPTPEIAAIVPNVDLNSATQPSTEPREVPVNPPIVYHGMLADPDGKGVGGVPFHVYHDDVMSPETPVETEGRTNPDGSFAVGPYQREESGTPNRIVMFDAPGFAWAWWNVGAANPLTLDKQARITLRRALPVAGIVTDSKSQPIRNAFVEADAQTLNDNTYGNAQFTALNEHAVITDGNGAFHFDRIPEGTLLHLYVHHPEYGADSTRTVVAPNRFPPVPAGMMDVAIQLSPAAVVHAQLIQAGKPLEREGVWIQAVDRLHAERPVWAQSDVHGKLEFDGLSEGRWDFIAPNFSTPDGSVAIRRTSVQLKPSETRNLNIPCEPGEIVHGVLKDSQTHKPLAQPMQINFPTPAGPDAIHVRSDDTGKFSFRLPIGQTRINVRSWEDGRFRDISQTLDVYSNMPVVEIEVRPRPIIRGQLTDSAGSPTAGVVVMSDNFTSGDVVFTQSDGRFALPAPENNNAGLAGAALNDDRTLGVGFTYTTADENQPLQLSLEPLATFTGRFLDDKGHPVSNNIRTGFSIRLPRGEMEVGDFIWKTDIAPDGKFSIGPVPAGYRLQLHTRSAGEDRYRRIMYYEGSQTLDLGQVRVQSGDSGPSSPRDAVIAGRLLDETGKPVAGVQINAEGNDIPITVTDLKGRFTMTHLPRDRETALSAYLDDYGSCNWSVAAGDQHAQLTMTPLGSEFIGKAAPDFIVARWLLPGSAKISDYRGKVVLLQTGTWLQWSPPGQSDATRAFAKYKDKGFVLITINQSWGINRLQDMQDWVKQNGITWPCAIDAAEDQTPQSTPEHRWEGATASVYASHHTSNMTYLIDKKGIVRACPNGKDKDIDAWVQKLLAE